MSLKTTLKSNSGRATRVYKTTDMGMQLNKGYRWWEAKSATERKNQLLATVAFLKQGQKFRTEETRVYSQLYTGKPMVGYAGPAFSKVSNPLNIAPGRPTYNLISSVTDTLVSRLTQDRPVPVFLTDNGDYKERNLAKKLNDFILGEFYRTKAYEIGEQILTDALVQGTGVLKIHETMDKKVGIERVLPIELFVDLEESRFGDPRRMYQVKYMDRAMVESAFPKHKAMAAAADKGILEQSDASRSVADLVVVVEGWALPSGEDTNDGWHSIVCSEGELFGEKWTKQKFPFVFLHHKKRPEGFWAQGVAESLMGTQLTLNDLLITIAQSIRTMGVPRVFVEEGSKCNTASFVNKIGTVIKYRGAAPIFATSPSNAPELYEERARLIQFGFEQEGLSMLSATSQKPSGLNSGEAQRVYQDINSDRFASLERRYTNFYVDLAYQLIDKALDIAERDGSYTTIFTDRKKGCKQIELPKIKMLKDPFIIQAYVQSSLPKDPAGRLQKVTEMIQSNMVTIQEGRRLLDFPDLGQVETLANASEERIYYILDEIIENGVYEGPDQFMNLAKATEIVTQYINLYSTCKLEEEKVQMLRDFFAEIQDLQMAAMPQPPMMPPEPSNQLAVPQGLPTSELLPMGPGPAPSGGGIPMMAEGGMVEDQKKNPSLAESDLPGWLQGIRQTTVPAFQQASEAVQSVPGLDFATSAFNLTSPAAYAFTEAGKPEPQGGILEQISHVPGTQAAANIPTGWKVLKGSALGAEQQFAKDTERYLELLKKLNPAKNKGIIDPDGRLYQEAVEIQNKYGMNQSFFSNNKPVPLDKYSTKEELIGLQKRSKQPNLEVARTPEEIAAKAQKEALDRVTNIGGGEVESLLKEGKPIDEVAKEVMGWRKRRLEEDLNRWKSELNNPRSSADEVKYAKRRLEELTQELKDFENVSLEQVERELIEDQRRWELITGETKKINEKRAELRAAEEERLKNVVVPIEIEGGPKPKGRPSTKQEDPYLKELMKLQEQKIKLYDDYFERGKMTQEEYKKAQQEVRDKITKLVDTRRRFENKEILRELPKDKGTTQQLDDYIAQELSELETRDIDDLTAIMSENLNEMGWKVDLNDLHDAIVKRLKPKKD